MAKQKTTSKSADRFGTKERPTLSQAKEAAGKIGDPKKIGRPKSAPENLKRTSVMADRAQMQRLKVQAAKEDRHMYELLQDAIEAYLKRKG
jgi:hypothetical protein